MSAGNERNRKQRITRIRRGEKRDDKGRGEKVKEMEDDGQETPISAINTTSRVGVKTSIAI